MAVPVVLVTAGARPVTAVESGGVPMTPVDAGAEPVTLVDAGGEPITLINEDGTPALLAFSAKSYLNGIAPYHWFDFINDRALYAGADVGGVSGATGYSFSRASQGYYTNSDGTLTLFGHNLLTWSEDLTNAAWTKILTVAASSEASPDGTATGVFRVSGTSGNVFQSVLTIGQIYTASVWVKSNGAGQDEFKLRIGSTESSTLTATTSWVRYTYTATADTAVASIRTNGIGSTDILVWHPQFELGSTATTYIPTTSAAAGALRRGDRGVLIEGARTNLLLRSQDFATTWFNAGGGTTVSANSIAAPDGTMTASTIIEASGAGNRKGKIQTISFTSGTSYTLTVFAKAKERAFVYLLLPGAAFASNRAAGFTLSGAGSVSSLDGSTIASITALANGWYRCTITSPATSTVSAGAEIDIADAGNLTATNPAYTGDGTSGLYLWGAQLEAASFPSSYIPTTTASATRAADVLTCTAGVSYPLSLWAEFERAVDTGGDEGLLQIDAGSNNDRAWLKVLGTTDIPVIDVTAGNVGQGTPGGSSAAAIGVTYKFAGRVQTNSLQTALDGTLGAEDTLATLPATGNTLRFGTRAAAANPSFGYIRRAAIFSSALSDANLQSVTT